VNLKIAFYNLTTTTKSGGIETFNWEMAKALARRGHAVHIYGGRSSFAFDRPSGISVHTFPFVRRERFPDLGTRFRRFMERLSFGLFALRDLIKGGYDYIYLIKPYDIPIALVARALSKAKVIFGSSGTEFFPGYRYLVKKVDHFFACSAFNARQIEAYCGTRPAVLYNGVDTRLFTRMKPDGELRNALSIRDTDIVMMTVGRLVRIKGLPYAIKAVGRLIEKGYRIKYFILGGGEEREHLQVLVKDIHSEERIVFLGDIHNSVIPRYYSLACLAVFSSIDESFSISVGEALACGVPTVATAVGGIPELVGDAGTLVPPRDEEALARAMETLISDASLREELGRKGRRRIEENFGWEMIAEKFETSLREYGK